MRFLFGQLWSTKTPDQRKRESIVGSARTVPLSRAMSWANVVE